MKNKKKVFFLIFLAAVLIGGIALGYSFSYFTANILGSSNNTVVTTGIMEIEFSDGPQVGLLNAIPGSYIEKSFSVKNTGTVDTVYDVYLSELVNNFTNKSDLVYTLASNDGGANVSETQVPDISSKIVSNKEIAVGVTHTYTLRITFKETNDNQDDNKDKEFSSVISINEVKDAPDIKNAVDSIIELASNSDLEYDGTADNNLRYIGANPNNYIDIGERYDTDVYYGYSQENNTNSYHKFYSSEQDCLNGSIYNKGCTKAHSANDIALWRIIGVMNNIQTESGQTLSLLKVIRDEELGYYSWDNSSSSVNQGAGINQWGESINEDGTPYEGADLMRELNTDYLGRVTVGTDGKWYSTTTCDYKDNLKPFTTLNTTTQNKIASVVWNLGSPTNNNGTYDKDGIIASISYSRERTNTTGKICSEGNYTYCSDSAVRTTSWTGKIALFYPSDYLYATSGGSTKDRSACLNSSLNDYGECKPNNWLHISYYDQWTISPAAHYKEPQPYSYGSHSDLVMTVYPYTSSSLSTYNAYGSNIVRPSVHLNSSVRIIGGDGTEANPYKID